MRFAFHCSAHESVEDVVRRAKHAEQAGFDEFLIADSQIRRVDPFMALAIAGLSTKRIRLGTASTNAVFRDPTIIACSMCSMDQVANGRALLGIGTGDVPVYSLGRKKSTLAQLEMAILEIKGLCSGEQTEVNGRRVRAAFGKRNIPVYVAADGPKTLNLAGRVGDGVMTSAGLTDVMVDWAHSQIEVGCSAIPSRKLSDLDVVHCAVLNIDNEDGQRAVNECRMRVANRAHHNFRFSFEMVPPDKREEVERFMKGFDITRAFDNENYRTLVTDYMVDRFAIAGTVDECISRIKRIERSGVKHLMVTPIHSKADELLQQFSSSIMREFSTETSAS